MGDMSAEMPTPQESEAKNFRELRESLIKLGEVEPNLIYQTTKNGHPEVIIVPSLDHPLRTEENVIPDDIDSITTVAITDETIRILDIIPPSHGFGSNGSRKFEGYAWAGISSYFSPNNGDTMTEEQIADNIGQDIQNPPMKYVGFSLMTGLKERGGRIVEITDADPEKKMRTVLKSLSNRSEANQKAFIAGGGTPTTRRELTPEQEQRYETLKASFDPKSFTPGENLATRFNNLAQQLKPTPPAKPV